MELLKVFLCFFVAKRWLQLQKITKGCVHAVNDQHREEEEHEQVDDLHELHGRLSPFDAELLVDRSQPDLQRSRKEVPEGLP